MPVQKYACESEVSEFKKSLLAYKSYAMPLIAPQQQHHQSTASSSSDSVLSSILSCTFG